MGCSDSQASAPARSQLSQAGPPQNYSNNNSTMFYQMQNAKRPKFLNPQALDEGRKQTLWAIIQRNSVKQFAFFVQNQNIPSNMEIGPANTFWNFAHFCARWDAFECLHYIIKRVYAEKSTLLLSLMNQQTIQGYTAIHVAIEWNAINCFYLILDCGGVDLTYNDKANNSVFTKAHLFKRQQMIQVLQKFSAANALMVLVQTQRVRGFQNFSQMASQNSFSVKTQYRLTNERINDIIDTKNRINKPPPPIPIQNQNKNDGKLKDYYNNMSKLEVSKNTQSEEVENEDINRQKLEQQTKYQQNQMKIKKQQAQQLKKNMEIQRQFQQNRLKEEIQQQINKQKAYEQSQLMKIEKQKQIMMRNIEMMHSTKEQAKIQASKGTKMICPDDIKAKYQAALSKGTKFVDSQFPAELKSIGNASDFKFGWSDCEWLRPEQIFPGGEYQVFDGISPDDVKQGTLGVCYYLALLSSVAENQQRIKKIFRFYDKELGFYAIQLYLQGKPITIIVDDLVPCMKGTKQPLFSKPNSPQTWVMVLEKAWVKLFGSYLAAEKMSPSDMFQNVLPSPCRGFIVDISKIDYYYDKILEYDQKNYIMVASSIGGDVESPPGIVKDHAYSLIGAYNIDGHKICKIRNPWGKTQFAGMYADSSPLWTSQLKNAVGFQNSDDGIFYLNPTELQSIMPIISASLYRDAYEYSYVEITSKSNEQVFYIINVKTKAEIAIKLTQQNERFRKNMEYENAPTIFQVYKLGDNYQGSNLSQGQPSTMHGGIFNLFASQNIYQTYEPGRYLIRLKILYDRAHPTSTRGTYRKIIKCTDGKNVLKVRQATSVLSIYGPQKYVFNRLAQQEGEKYMKNLYKSFLESCDQTQQRLRSVGQDLKPMVLSKSCKMRNQIVYLAENLLANNSINFKFEFQVDKLRNCSYYYNVNKESNSCEWILQPNGGWNLATLQIDHAVQQVATEGHLQSRFKIIR